jgi:hypothetical protein
MIFKATIDDEAIEVSFAYFSLKGAFPNPQDYEIQKKVNNDFWLKIEHFR